MSSLPKLLSFVIVFNLAAGSTCAADDLLTKLRGLGTCLVFGGDDYKTLKDVNRQALPLEECRELAKNYKPKYKTIFAYYAQIAGLNPITYVPQWASLTPSPENGIDPDIREALRKRLGFYGLPLPDNFTID